MADRLVLVRHGEAEGWRPGMFLGRTDARLSERGRRQAALAVPWIPAGPDCRFVTSPLARARETAEFVLTGRHAALEADPDLREIDFGEWEGLTFDQVAHDHPDLARNWAEFQPGFAFPCGERLQDFFARVERAADALAATDSGTVVVFTHGGVIRTLICSFLGLSPRDYLLFDVTPGSISTMRLWGRKGVLTGLRPAEEPACFEETWPS